MITNDISDQESSLPALPELADLLISIDKEIAGELRKQGGVPQAASDRELEEIGRHICFTLGGRQLAVPLTLVLEVGELEVVQPLPFLPDWVRGVTNIRGEIVSVTDLAVFFNIASTASEEGRTFIIIHDGDVKTAVIVDRITGTRLLYRKKRGEVPKDAGNSDSKSVLSQFLSGSAVFLLNNTERELELFDGGQLLSSIRI
jgi:chemotaxis signal transduction protein